MNTVDDLRRSLADHASTAPAADGIVEAALVAAARVRRRRRGLGAAGATVLVACAIAATVIVRPGGAPTVNPPPHASTSAATPYRPAVQLTVDLAPDSGFYRLSEGSNGAYQYMIVRPTVLTAGAGATVVVADPGTVDPATFLQGERLTVAGHPAYYTEKLRLESGSRVGPGGPVTPVEVAAIGWPDASGAWVILFRSERAELIDVAEHIRLGPPRSMRAAIRLGYLPAGLRYEYAGISGPEENATLVFQSEDAPLGRPPFNTVMFASPVNPLNISIQHADPHRDAEIAWLAQLPGATQLRVAGHDAWSARYGNPHPIGTSTLIVRTPTCYLRLDAWNSAQIQLAELTRIVEGAQLADCTDKSTWFNIP
jgi:hypothetical protein